MAKNKKEKKDVKSESLWTKFRTFCHGVRVEAGRIHWTDKKDLVKYSFATLIFVVFLSLFFYVIDAVNALVHTLF